MKKTFPILVGIVVLLMITACPTPNDPVNDSANTTVQSDEKEITALSFIAADNNALSSDVTGTISGTNIDLTVPYGTDITALVATFATTGESVTIGGTAQSSGTTANDFSSPVTYTIMAEDGSFQEYTVTVTVAANTAKEITAFSFTTDANSALSIDVIGTISGTNIDLTVPHGTDVIGLVATFSTTGASVIVVDQGNSEQESGGSANDFSKPVIYTVTAEDGSTREYTVTVTVAANTAKEITTFSFTAAANSSLSSDVTGEIRGTDIDLTVPYGTDVTALVANYTTTGESVTIVGTAQSSGTTANNFSNPVTYTVTAGDSSTQDYTVTVTIAANTAKEITAFSFTAADNNALSSEVTGRISGTDIDLTVPFGTDVTALVPSFSTTGESVTMGGTAQSSGTTDNDFSSPVTYTVIAEDNSTQNYTVMVTIAANTAKEITAFSFTAAANGGLTSDVTGTISGTDIDLTVPFGTDVAALVATFTTTGETVTVGGTAQTSGTTANNFSSPVTYRVTAEDGSTREYTVTVTVAANTAKEITDFSFTADANGELSSDVTGTISGTDIELTVPFGTDVTALVASFITTGESVTVGDTAQTSGTTANDFSSAVTYRVTAEDGSKQDYTVMVNITPPATTKELTDFSFTAADNSVLSSDVTGTISGTDIELTVPFGTDVTALVASFITTVESVTVGDTAQTSGITSNNFSDLVMYRVTAEDGSTQDYTVMVTVPVVAEDASFGSATNPGDIGVVIFSETSQEITMVYAQDRASISFPRGIDDTGSATVNTQFWIAETQFTNGQLVALLQWAYDNGRIVETSGAHNEINSTEVKYGGRQLLNLDTSGENNQCRVIYSNGDFTVESGYGDHPVTDVTWYGAVMLSNWLTEMRDGHNANLVYSNIPTSLHWLDTNTIEDNSKNGYRLPSADEWEYAARYLGKTAPSTGDDLYTERKDGNENPGWTDGYYWTPGNYGSGATADYNNTEACQAVAVYYDSDPRPTTTAFVKSLGEGSANTLGLYDMSGNVWEWCFTEGSEWWFRSARGGSWEFYALNLRVGYVGNFYAGDANNDLGFRFCRTAD